jgi:hypothetical protein
MIAAETARQRCPAHPKPLSLTILALHPFPMRSRHPERLANHDLVNAARGIFQVEFCYTLTRKRDGSEFDFCFTTSLRVTVLQKERN